MHLAHQPADINLPHHPPSLPFHPLKSKMDSLRMIERVEVFGENLAAYFDC